MSMWTHTIRIVLDATVPNIESIASKVGRTFDNDTGGDKSFHLSEDGLHLETAAPCTAEFVVQAQYLKGHADRLFSATQHDYVIRWPEHTPPTREECGVFINSIVLFEVT